MRVTPVVGPGRLRLRGRVETGSTLMAISLENRRGRHQPKARGDAFHTKKGKEDNSRVSSCVLVKFAVCLGPFFFYLGLPITVVDLESE